MFHFFSVQTDICKIDKIICTYLFYYCIAQAMSFISLFCSSENFTFMLNVISNSMVIGHQMLSFRFSRLISARFQSICCFHFQLTYLRDDLIVNFTPAAVTHHIHFTCVQAMLIWKIGREALQFQAIWDISACNRSRSTNFYHLNLAIVLFISLFRTQRHFPFMCTGKRK